MEKEKLYHVALDDYEHGVVIRSLNDEKTKLMEEGKSADAVDASAYFPSSINFVFSSFKERMTTPCS